MTKSSLIEELAVCVGQTVFSVHCTPLVSHDIILNCIKGIASTGIVHCCVYNIVHVHVRSIVVQVYALRVFI